VKSSANQDFAQTPLFVRNQSCASFVPTLTGTKVVTLEILPTPNGGRADSARGAVAFEQCSWVTATVLADELGITRRTLGRWLRDIPLGFPRPRCVNHRLYFERSAIDAWKTATAVKAAGGR
jgi:predicted DNA-binding transcriptional regulator AlpA